MREVRQTEAFAAWVENLRDDRARARVVERVRRLSLGNAGDVEAVGEGISELRIHYGPGYRVYFTTRGRTLVILLCGGGKSSQSRDIAEAKRMAKDLSQ